MTEAAANSSATPIKVANVLGKLPTDPKLEDVYTIGAQLGKGAFGVVRLATKKDGGQDFAVKSISKAKLVNKDDVKDVLDEIAMMNLVTGHPNVVTIKSTHEDRDCVHIVMELCAGGELFASIVESGNFSEKKAAAVFRKMVEAVHHCQELGVMHRDLKPENFLLTSKEAHGEIKLTDFGLGVFFKPGQKFTDLVGSPYYVAPEVLRKDYSSEADLWSLGVILYILLSGLPPFWGDNEEQIFKMTLRGHIDFKTEPWPTVSDAAKHCVTRLLELDPTKRATTREILQHDWLLKEGVALDAPLDNVVLTRMRQFGQMNKLKKMCLMVVGSHLSLEEIGGMKELFKSIDTDNSGTISVTEMRNALAHWGHRINEVDMANLLSIADVDDDGLLDYNEFVACTMHMSKLEREELLQKAFKDLDKDCSGTIDAAELAQALKRYGIYGANVEDLLKSADVNGDGQVDYLEFSAMLRNQDAALRESRNVKQTIARF